MRPSTISLLIVGSCNAAAVAAGLGYGFVLLNAGLPLVADWATILTWAAVGFGFDLAVFVPVVLWRNRALDAVWALRGRGEAASPESLADARRLAGLLPATAALVSTILWTVDLLGYPLFLRAAGLEQSAAALWHTVIAVGLIGLLAGTLIFHVEELYARRLLLGPLQLAGGAAAVRAPGMALKLTVLLLTTVALPLGVLAVAASAGTLTPGVLGYVAVAFFVFGVVQSLFIGASLTTPVRLLAAAMERVRQNALDARAPVLATDEVGRLAEGFNGMVEGLARAEFVRETFGRYVSPAVMQDVLQGRVPLGGELREVTVLFSDLRDFTALSESLPATEVVAMLNGYLDAMVEVIVENGGTVDKFIGDAVMATFGVPVARPDDPARGVRTALGMLARLKAWNAAREARGEPALRMGIGVHTGEVVAGNIGSQKKLEYTVIGDAVNTASRIEQLTKVVGAELLVSEATFRRVEAEVEAEALAPVEVKGKRDALRLYRITRMKASTAAG